MIEDLKAQDVIHQVGGRFRLCALIQKRMLELMQGSRPLIEDTEGKTTMEVVIQEIVQGKIELDFSKGEPEKPTPL